jgi:hypothetical protein
LAVPITGHSDKETVWQMPVKSNASNLYVTSAMSEMTLYYLQFKESKKKKEEEEEKKRKGRVTI